MLAPTKTSLFGPKTNIMANELFVRHQVERARRLFAMINARGNAKNRADVSRRPDKISLIEFEDFVIGWGDKS